MRVNTMAAMPMVYIPAPTASPIPAVAQIPAAVVSPRTICFWKMMVPAPINPIPLTTCAATRLGSSVTLLSFIIS